MIPDRLVARGLAAALFERSPLSTVVYDLGGFLLFANSAFERLFGLRLDTLPADYSLLTDPQLAAPDVRSQLVRAFAGEAVVLPPVRYVAEPRLGVTTTTWTQAHLYPLRDEHGGLTAVVLVHVDLTARMEAEEALRLSRASAERAAEDLQAILGSISDPFVVYDEAWRFQYINRAARDRLALMRPDTPQHDLLGACVWDAYPHLAGTALERAMRRCAAARDAGSFEEYSVIAREWVEARCYPMPGGSLAVTWRDVTARKRKAEAEHFVARATGILGSSLDHEETLAALARLVVPQLADWCAVHLCEDDGSIRRAAVAHADPGQRQLAHEVERRYQVRPDDRMGAAMVIRTGQPQLVPEVTDEILAAGVPDLERLSLLRELDLRSVLVVPLTARGRTLGALSLAATTNGRRYDDGDLDLAMELGRRAALAVDNARLHQAAVAAERAAAAHARDTERFRRAQASAPDGFALVTALRDASGRVVDFTWDWANDAVLRLTGATLDAIRGQRVLVRNPGLLETGVFADHVRAVDTGQPYESEVYYRHEGIDRWFRVTAVPLDDALALTLSDITSRKRDALRTLTLYETTRALAVATTRTEVGTVVLERMGPVVGAAASSLIEFDAERDELVLVAERGFDASALREWQRYPLAANTPGADAVRSGEMVTIASRAEWVVRYPHHLQWAERSNLEGTAVVPLRIGDRVLGIVTLHARGPRTFDAEERAFLLAFGDQCAQAIERVRLFEAERRMREAAEAANRSKTEFLASMSHELRTPLNAIGGYADLLLLGVRGEVTPVQRLDLERINRSQRHLLSVINDILNFARVEAGFVDYALASVSVEALVQEVGPLVQPQLEARSLAFSLDAGPPGLRAMADGEKVRQILLNLLANAIKFTREGGHVAIIAHEQGDTLAIRVRDSGIGIPSDRLAAVFEPFVQLERSLTRPAEGTGLGLAISRDLARGMGGELVVESEVGSGSTFTLTLPRAPDAGT